MVKSPLRYPGGKSKVIKFIAPLIPEFDEYREPFLGGGSVFVYLKQKHPDKKFWINDIYTNLYLFWKYVQEQPEQLVARIQYWKNSAIDGKRLFRFLVDNIDEFGELDRAAVFFVLNRITFSGTSESGGYSSEAFHNRFTQSSINRVTVLSEIMDNVKITNLDYQQVVEKEGENVFIFLDPPYYSASKFTLYGKRGGLNQSFDHERLAEVLKQVRHKWLITYDDSEYIRELFSFANITEWNFNYGMRNVKRRDNLNGKELFISNYPIQQL